MTAFIDFILAGFGFRDLLGANQRNTELKLLRADYHGCIMKVVSAKCSTLLDLEGILLMETKNTWKIITTNDAIKGKS